MHNLAVIPLVAALTGFACTGYATLSRPAVATVHTLALPGGTAGCGPSRPHVDGIGGNEGKSLGFETRSVTSPGAVQGGACDPKLVLAGKDPSGYAKTAGAGATHVVHGGGKTAEGRKPASALAGAETLAMFVAGLALMGFVVRRRQADEPN